jgi:two-component system sensor histidine kinase/response regulator
VERRNLCGEGCRNRTSAAAGFRDNFRSFPGVIDRNADLPETSGFALVKSLRTASLTSPAIVMMLASNGLHNSAARSRELGIANTLEKPLRPSELLQSVLGTEEEPSTIRAVAQLPTRRSLHVLLAEDSPVNRQLVIEILLQQGHTVEVACNGREAVGALQCGRFDIVLMDVQMPEMDGLQATSEIRRQEQKAGAHVPIIALTAHAMTGARELCQEAGMDGYLQKPFYPADLYNALSPYCSRRDESTPANAYCVTEESAQSVEPQVLNAAEALARAGGNKQLLGRVCQVFLENLPAMWTEIQTSVANTDAAAIQRSAHTLKGSASAIGAQAASASARDLEMMARSRTLDGAGTAFGRLEHELTQLRTAVADLRDQFANC